MKPHRWSKLAILTLIACVNITFLFAQPPVPPFNIVSDGSFTAFPVRYQLYPRIITDDGQPDVAVVNIVGNVSNTNITSVRIVVNRDLNNNGSYTDPGEDFFTDDQILSFNNGSASFSFTVNQVAQLANYRYQFYTLIGGSATLQTTTTDVVAGDVYIIQGQSNAEADNRDPAPNQPPLPTNDPNNEPNRQFVRTYGNASTTPPVSFPNAWNVPNANSDCCFTGQNIGQWGMRLGTQIATTYNIPVAVFNGSYGGASVEYFKRALADPNDLTTNYGRLLTRIQAVGLQSHIRGIFWYQGETNGYTGGFYRTTQQYITEFGLIRDAWFQDYGPVSKVYIIQIKGCYIYETSRHAVEIQEAQRQIATADDGTGNRIDIISTTNVPQWSDECHYDYVGGYQVIGDRVFNAVARDLYDPSRASLRNLYTPVPTQARFTMEGNPDEATEVTINLNLAADDIAISGNPGDLINNFILSTTTPTDQYIITSVSLDNVATPPNNNWQIKIAFNRAPGTNVNPTRVSYWIPDGAASPAIANGSGTGIGLIGFDNLSIDLGVLPIDPMQLNISRIGKYNRLKWTAEFNDQFEYFEVERSANRSNFKAIASMEASGISGIGRYEVDDKQPLNGGSFYRIKGVKLDGKEVYSQVVVMNSSRVLKEGVLVFPNPVTSYVNATISVKEAGPAELLLHNSSGQLVSSRKIMLQEDNNSISLGELLDHRPGMYILTVITKNQRYITKIVKTQ